MTNIAVPVLGQLVPGGLEYGRFYLVEFEPQSIWYETSLTVAAHASRDGIKTEYHTLLHPPGEVREALQNLGVDVRKLEEKGFFRILDTYSVTVGFQRPDTLSAGPDPYQSRTIDVEEYGRDLERRVKAGVPEEEKRWLHVDDATTVLCRYNEEKAVLDYKRTRWVPYARARNLTEVAALVTDTASQSFYREFESFSDGIFDFSSREEKGEINHYARIRSLRGRACDTAWHQLALGVNGDVKLGSTSGKAADELGIRGWLKGSKK